MCGCDLGAVIAMKADGHDLDQSLLLQRFPACSATTACGEALQVLDDVSAGEGAAAGELAGVSAIRCHKQQQRWLGGHADSKHFP